MPEIRTSAYAAGSGSEYTAYDQLAPSQKAYISSTLSFLDLESTPQRRDNLARLMGKGTWAHLINAMRQAIDNQGQKLRG